LDGRVERAVAGDDHDLEVLVDLLRALEDADAAEPGHLEVERHDVDRRARHDVERLVARGRGHDLAVALENRAQRLSHTHLVIDHQDPRTRAHERRRRAENMPRRTPEKADTCAPRAARERMSRSRLNGTMTRVTHARGMNASRAGITSL